MSARQATLGGVVVDLVEEEEALARFDAALRREAPPVAVESANLDHLYWFPQGSHARHEHQGLHWLTLMDGAPLVYKARQLTGLEHARLTGADLLGPMLDIAQRQGVSVGVFGGRYDMHQRLRPVLAERYPALRVAGMWSPAREDLTNPTRAGKWADIVRESGAGVVVVALGKPRQEKWIDDYGLRTGARALLAFGAATDFLAGTSRRAPAFYQKHGLEWAYRLARDPRRLARRYLVEGPGSLVRLLRHSDASTP